MLSRTFQFPVGSLPGTCPGVKLYKRMVNKQLDRGLIEGTNDTNDINDFVPFHLDQNHWTVSKT